MSSSRPDGMPLRLSSGVVTVTGAGSLELSITTHVLGEQVMLASADPRGAGSTRYHLRTNPMLLAAMPDSVEIAGRRHTGVSSYAITLTFSDGAAASMSWRVTVAPPDGTAAGAWWRVTVPFCR